MTGDETQLAFAAARDICRRHARSFYFASIFLPAARRRAAYAVYAFCRMMDDAIDEPDAATAPAAQNATPIPVADRLREFRERLDEIYCDRLHLPAIAVRTEQQHALRAFAFTVRQYGLPKQYFVDLAEGCAMDLSIHRYKTWPQLQDYCYHVAGVVGLMMCAIFGTAPAEANRPAIALGNAMQLTNILRDVKEDFARGRIYLPGEDMVRFGYTETDLQNGVVNEAFRELMRFEIDRARAMYKEGVEGLKSLANDGSRLTTAVMAAVYGGILDQIERQGYDVFSRRAAVPLVRKLSRLPMAWRWTHQCD